MRACAALSLFLLLPFTIFSQGSVSGVVMDKASKQPIELATIELIRLPDSSLVSATGSDKKGRFLIDDVKAGTYFLKCSFIGYERFNSTAFSIAAGDSRNLGSIELLNTSSNLHEVTVTARKDQLNASIDRKIYNVDQDIMSRSGSASEILKNIPSVEVDIDGAVSLRGSGDVVIFINGKPSPLMGRSRAEVLQQLPANSIERIEVITNPSARYRPDGTSGIINIVLKKNVRNGFNGSLTASAGNHDRYSGNLSLNYRPKKLNLFGSFGWRQDYRYRSNFTTRTNLDAATGNAISYFEQQSSSFTRPGTHFFTGGMDYNPDERNSLGISGSYFNRKQTRYDLVANTYYNLQKAVTEKFDRSRYDPEKENQPDLTAYFEHKFAEEDHELRLEFNHSRADEQEDNRYANRYLIPSIKTAFENTLIRVGENENQLTLDYTRAVSETSRLEAGYDGSYNRIDLDYFGEYYDELQKKFTKDTERSNRFIYNDAIHAVYATWQQGFERFGYSVGLRAEEALIRTRLLTLDSFVNNDYFKIYPTIHLSYKLKEETELQLNYSKRVNRPDADELNPFPEFQDPRNLRAGNPRLLPEIIHSVEMGIKWQHKNFSFVPSVYYRYKVHGFTSVIVPLNDTTLLTTNENLTNDQSAGLELIFSAKAGNWFSSSMSTNFFYNRIDASGIGFAQSRSVYSMSTNFTGNFKLSKNTNLQLSGNYRSARLTPQGKNYPSIVFNSGIRQELFNNKLSLTLTASDIFNSLRQKSEIHSTFMQQVSIGRRDARIIYLGASYRFGSFKKPKEEKLDFDNNL